MGDRSRSRSISERRRILSCLAIGLAVAGILAPFIVWQLVVLLAWSVSAATFLGWVWRDVAHLDAAQTAAVATREDDTRAGARALTVVASLASLGAVLVGLARASTAAIGLEIELVAASLVTVIVSWAVVHCVYTLRYAHLFYADPAGGVDFPGDNNPTYQDFAYLAYTVGMTYQVADTNISGSDIRRALLGHAVLSYVFGAVIIAVAINLVAGFV